MFILKISNRNGGEIMQKYKGHVIATTACIGGELGTSILAMNDALLVND